MIRESVPSTFLIVPYKCIELGEVSFTALKNSSINIVIIIAIIIIIIIIINNKK